MGLSKYPSKLSLPQINPGVATVLEYLIARFPGIDPITWRQRMSAGRVHWHDGSRITEKTAYQAQQRVYYYREVENEPLVPFEEKVLFQNEEFMVVFKPHFLAVTPGGIWVDECLQNRLRRKTGIDELQALHRLDRATAGLVLLSVNPNSRQYYHKLFKTRQIHKTYHAIAKVDDKENLAGQEWHVKNRIEPSSIRFRMHTVNGKANSHSVIRCLEHRAERALFELNPITGKTHQLRVHMQTLGWPILHDKYYPILQQESPDDYDQPLRLVATGLRFVDPVTRQLRVFKSEDTLSLDESSQWCEETPAI